MEHEKRQHPRALCQIDSLYENLDSPRAKNQFETQVVDLSEGGLRFRAGCFIPVQNRLLFLLRLPKLKAIEVVAQPAWIREVPSIGQYEIGAKFLSISDADRGLIRQYIQNFDIPQGLAIIKA